MKLLKKLLYFAGPHKGPLLLSLLCRILHQGGTIAVLVIAGWQAQLAYQGQQILIFRHILFPLLLIGVVKAGFRYAEQLSGHKAAFSIQENFRNLIFRKLEQHAPDNIHQLSSGELISRIVSDIEKVEVFYAHTIVPVLSAVVVSIAAVAAAGRLIGGFAPSLLGIFLFLVGAVIPYFHLRRHYTLGADIRQNFGKLNSLLSDIVTGFREISNWNRTVFFKDRIGERQSVLQKGLLRLSHHNGLKEGLTDFAIGAGMLWLVLFYTGKGIGSVPFFPMLCLYSASFSPVLSLIKTVEDLSQTLPACQRVLDILDQADEPTPPGRIIPVVEQKEEILLSLHHLKDFRFHSPLFQEDGFFMKQGDYILLLGESGSGKTTLMQLAAGIHGRSPVCLSVKGKVIKHSEDRDRFWQEISYVPQNTVIFPGSLWFNLTLQEPEDPRREKERELEEVLEQVCLTAFRNNLEFGLSTPLGVRGAQVSGGEAQRIGLARALLRNTEIYLLDEAFSFLDADTEIALRDHLESFWVKKTVMEICHKPQYVTVPHRTYMLKEGRLEEVVSL